MYCKSYGDRALRCMRANSIQVKGFVFGMRDFHSFSQESVAMDRATWWLLGSRGRREGRSADAEREECEVRGEGCLKTSLAHGFNNGSASTTEDSPRKVNAAHSVLNVKASGPIAKHRLMVPSDTRSKEDSLHSQKLTFTRCISENYVEGWQGHLTGVNLSYVRWDAQRKVHLNILFPHFTDFSWLHGLCRIFRALYFISGTANSKKTFPFKCSCLRGHMCMLCIKLKF